MKGKKLEKDLERQKDEGMKLVEKNEELTRENQTLQTQNLNLREKITEIESEFNQNKVLRPLSLSPRVFISLDSQPFRSISNNWKNNLNAMKTKFVRNFIERKMLNR